MRIRTSLVVALVISSAGCCFTSTSPPVPVGPMVGGDCGFRPVPGVVRVVGVDPAADGTVHVRYRFEPTEPIVGAWGWNDPELSFDAPCAECITALGIAVDGTTPITPQINFLGGGCAPWQGLDPWSADSCSCPAAQ